MDISKIDARLASMGIEGVSIEWISSHDSRVSVHGVYFDEKEGLYRRVPDSVVEAANPSLYSLSRMTAGGRLRFVTNSPFIAIKASLPGISPLPHMSITGSHGFSVYADGIFEARYAPVFQCFQVDTSNPNPFEERVVFAEKKNLTECDRNRLIEIYFPLYGGVAELYIGVEEGSSVEIAPPYKNKNTLLFYGSSITQGGCVTRPGNDYISIIARRLDCDYINLGFSGNGNAEDAMIDYINSFDAALYGFDYNMYPDCKDRVLPSHFSIYERIREKHPASAILLYDKPAEYWDVREAIIRSTYEKAKELDDKKVAFVPARALLGNTERDCCLVDCAHPNDLGAMRIADALYPVIKELLEK